MQNYFTMKEQFRDLLELYEKNFTDKKHHSAFQNNMKNFQCEILIKFCEEEIEKTEFIESAHNSNYLFKLIDYAARTDSYFEEQRNRLLGYSLAIGGFSITYISTVVGINQK